jgi:hypothetical protein
LYIHLFTWPGTSFQLSKVQGKVGKAYLLADKSKKGLKVTQQGDAVTVAGLPDKAPGELATVLVLETK